MSEVSDRELVAATFPAMVRTLAVHSDSLHDRVSWAWTTGGSRLGKQEIEAVAMIDQTLTDRIRALQARIQDEERFPSMTNLELEEIAAEIWDLSLTLQRFGDHRAPIR